MANIWRNAIRHPEDVGGGFWRRRVLFNTGGDSFSKGDPAGAFPICKVERGSVITQCRVYKAVAVAGSAAALSVGTLANPTAFMSTTDTAGGTVGYSTGGTGPQVGQEMTADTQVYVFFGAAAGATLTAGDVDVHVHFGNPRNWSDNLGGQAS